MVLETPKLVRSLFMTIPKSVPNFIIFPCSLHRAAIDSHWKRRRIIIIIIIIIIIKHTIAIGALALWARPLNIAASSDAGAKPGKSSAEREQQNGRNRAYIEKTYRFRSSKLNRNSDEKEQT